MLYLHIGAPKTGSNAVQRYLQTHQASLAAVGLHYPDLGRDGRHKQDALKTAFHMTTGLGGEVFAELRAWRDAHPDQNLVISEEAFYRFGAAEVQRLASGMLGSGPVTILVWFRDYASHVVSLYGQAAKAGRRVVDFDTFFDDYMSWTGHAQLISQWGEAFGWSQVKVRLYSPEALVGGDTVTDFLSVLGLDRSTLERSAEGPAKAARPNASPSWESVELTRAVCQVIEERAKLPDRERVSSALRAAIRHAAETAAPAGSRAEYLTAAQRSRCNAATLADLALLNQHLPAPGLPTPSLRDGPGRTFLPSVQQVDQAVITTAMALLALELGADLPDDKRARKQARHEKLAAPLTERKAARREARKAGGDAALPTRSKTRVKPEKDKSQKKDKAQRGRAASAPGDREVAADEAD